MVAFSSQPILVRTSAVQAAPRSEPDGETFPGQVAAAEPPPARDYAPGRIVTGPAPDPDTFLGQLARARGAPVGPKASAPLPPRE